MKVRDVMDAYRTLSASGSEAVALYEIQKSKFIAHAVHVETEEAARDFILAMKKKYYDARHNCSAYILGERADKAKSNDDGEPGGTAGNPILEALKKRGVTDACVVVTRYFGGIKLGAGGLIRAYGHTAGLAIEAAGILEMRPFIPVDVSVAYDQLAPLEHYLRSEAIRTEEPAYAEDVTLHLLLPPEELEPRMAELTDRTAGRARIHRGEPRRIACPVGNAASD